MYLPHSHTMKLVYQLEVELRERPELAAEAQALTLDESRPHAGLSGAPGLFGSEAWREATRNGKLERADGSGIITRAYFAGQDSRRGDEVNSFLYRNVYRAEVSEGVYLNDRGNMRLFKPGHRVAWAAVLAPLKMGGGATSRVMLEMAVSLKPEA